MLVMYGVVQVVLNFKLLNLQVVVFGEGVEWMKLGGAALIVSGTVAVSLDTLFNKSNKCQF